MATEIVRRRRDYSAGLKEQILLECAQPGASVAKIAMTHGINANIVHGWRKLAREANALMLPAPSFVQVTVAAEDRAAAPDQQIDLEVRRGPLTVNLSWPMTEVADLGIWLRELLR